MKKVNSVVRAAEILNFLSQSNEPVGLSEISRALKDNKTSVYRMLLTLEDLHLVSKQGQKYRLGYRVLQLGSAYLRQLDIRREARPYMEKLRALTGETVALSIPVDQHRVIVETLESPQEIQLRMEIGKLSPLHAGSTGKALLAFMPPEKIDDLIRETGLPRLTPNTIVDPEKLKAELQQIRSQGFAMSISERRGGACGIAAPILNAEGRVVASIGISGPTTRWNPATMLRYVEPLKEACFALSVAQGYERHRAEAEAGARLAIAGHTTDRDGRG
jgi:DNA-binding IclR family transcriptional regulator